MTYCCFPQIWAHQATCEDLTGSFASHVGYSYNGTFGREKQPQERLDGARSGLKGSTPKHDWGREGSNPVDAQTMTP